MRISALTLNIGARRRLEWSFYAGDGALDVGRDGRDSTFVLFGLVLSSWGRWMMWQVLWRDQAPASAPGRVVEKFVEDKGGESLEGSHVVKADGKAGYTGRDESGEAPVTVDAVATSRAPPASHKRLPNIGLEGDMSFFLFLGALYYAAYRVLISGG